MKITMLSMWYGDASKHLADRALHLLGKEGITRWVWAVRPARDCTQDMLDVVADFAGKGDEVSIYLEPEDQPDERIERLSKAGDVLLSTVEDEDYVLWHESDLFTLPGVAGALAASGAAACGGWPVLSHSPTHPTLGVRTPRRVTLNNSIFYDTWGYRSGGVRFSNNPPYHDCYQPTQFALDSVGSVVLVKASYIRHGARMNGRGIVGLCDAIREMGGDVMCDPAVPVVQPVELWTLNDD